MELTKQLCIQYSSWVMAVLAVWILVRCALSMLRERCSPELWGYLELPDGSSRALNHWEFVLGCSKSSDIMLEDPSVERIHASMHRGSDGRWFVSDLDTHSGVQVNGEFIHGKSELHNGDELTLGNVSMHFLELSEEQRRTLQRNRPEPGRKISPSGTLLLVMLFQILQLFQHLNTCSYENEYFILISFALFIAMEWGFYFFMRAHSVRGFEPETIAFFLTGIGFSVVASSTPGELVKQCLLFIVAVSGFYFLGIWLRKLRRLKKTRWAMGFAALGFLALNLLLSEAIWGAKNWLSIAGQSLQPSEFVKLAYIYAGASTIDRIYRRRNIFMYICFSAFIVGALALMGDFGTALVFFTCFLVVSYMRSGSLLTLGLALGGAAAAVVLILTVKPYIAQRFATWGNAWSDPLGTGYQQVRAMTAVAAGGLFGRGAGGGWMKDIVAANTDLVFAVVCEEFGLIVGICCILAILLLAVFTVLSARGARSSYYVIASCAAVTILMAQLALNVFGSLDLLPFTGVTFPFVSKGGSSLISCWAMLAYIKAGDTRQNASFALQKFRLQKSVSGKGAAK